MKNKQLQHRLKQYSEISRSVVKPIKRYTTASIGKTLLTVLPVAGAMLIAAPEVDAQVVAKKQFRKAPGGVPGATQTIAGTATTMAGLGAANSFEIVLKSSVIGTHRIQIDGIGGGNNLEVHPTNKGNLKLRAGNVGAFLYAQTYDPAATASNCNGSKFATAGKTYMHYSGNGFPTGTIKNLGFRISNGGGGFYYGFARVRVNTGKSITFYGAAWNKTLNTCVSPNVATTAILPVEFISFGATPQEDQIRLDWETGLEKNNSGFEVERSLDGKIFESLSFIRGAGTTQEKQNYSYIDERAKSNETYYYRLKQIDFDGTVSYSNTVSANLEKIDAHISDFFPNPTNTGISSLKYVAKNDANLGIEIYDVAGQLLRTEQVSLTSGINHLRLNVADLPKGHLFVKFLEDGREAIYKKLIVR